MKSQWRETRRGSDNRQDQCKTENINRQTNRTRKQYYTQCHCIWGFFFFSFGSSLLILLFLSLVIWMFSTQLLNRECIFTHTHSSQHQKVLLRDHLRFWPNPLFRLWNLASRNCYMHIQYQVYWMRSSNPLTQWSKDFITEIFLSCKCSMWT